MKVKHEMSAFRSLLAAFAAFAAACSVSCAPESGYVALSGYAQGGNYSVKINMDGVDASPESLKSGIDSILNLVDNSLSGYNANSILSRLNSGERVMPDSIFLEMYRLSRRYFDMTGGAVDVSAGALFDVWGFGFTSDSLPSAAKVSEIKEYVGMDRLVPDLSSALAADGSVSARDIVADGRAEHLPVLNFNAVAQGYSCDLVADYLEKAGVEDMLVDIGGEIVCAGLNPGGNPWTIGVDRPVDGNNVSGADLKGILQAGPDKCGVVTSGNYRKFYMKDGRKYAHTIDPLTGYPVSHSLLSATVIAPTAAMADALATYCMVIGEEKAAAYIEGRDDIGGYLIYQDEDGRMRTWKSSGFRLLQD